MATRFADIFPIKQLSSHEYEVCLDENWCIGTVPNGGYTTSLFLMAARSHMQMTHSKRSAPNPINLHLEFFRRTQVGPGRFIVKDVKLGARISNLHLILSQEQNGKWVNEVEGYITMTNIANETGMSIDTQYVPYPPRLDVDLKALQQKGQDLNWIRRGKEPFPKFRRAVQNIEMYLVKPSRRPSDRPKSINDQWSRFSPFGQPGGRWTNDSLGFLVDMFPQIIEGYVNPTEELSTLDPAFAAELAKTKKPSSHEPKRTFWYPTLVLNLDIKKLLPEEGVEWLFTRVRAKGIRNGRFDLEVEVWDADNELVATSTHASLAVDSARNITRNGSAQKSKI